MSGISYNDEIRRAQVVLLLFHTLRVGYGRKVPYITQNDLFRYKLTLFCLLSNSFVCMCLFPRSGQREEYYATTECLRYKQSGVLRFRLLGGILHTHGHDGHHVCSDYSIAA